MFLLFRHNMMPHVPWMMIAFLISIVFGCAPAGIISPEIPPSTTGTISTDLDNVDFGTLWSERSIAVQTLQPDMRWLITSARKSAWLSVSIEQATGNILTTVRVNRGFLPQGIGYDTLLLYSIRTDGSTELAHRLPVVANNNGTLRRVSYIQNFIEEQANTLASSIELPPIDTTASLFISAGRISPDGFPQAHALIACGVQSPLPFVEIGNTILFEGNSNVTPSIAVRRRGFSYVSGRTGANAIGSINLPNALPIAPNHIQYDESTWHRWSIPALASASSFFTTQSIAQTAWQDSILSPATPVLIGASDTITLGQDLRVRWLPTLRNDDMMFIVVPGLNGWRALQAIVNDNQGEYIFPASQVRAGLAGRSGQVSVCMVRYRTKNIWRNGQPAQLVACIQRAYNMTLR